MPTRANYLERLQLPKKCFAMILAGGRGSRLKQLTERRAKPAVFFGGKFRIVDFALSNCLNSNIRRIGMATQYKSHSLLRHIQRGWSFLKTELNEHIDLLPAQQRITEEAWYRGTADAVYQNIDIIRDDNPEYILILAGDHVYKMDYAQMLAYHVERGAQCTVACIEVPLKDAQGFGVMAVDPSDRITDFVEKPAHPPAMPKPTTTTSISSDQSLTPDASMVAGMSRPLGLCVVITDEDIAGAGDWLERVLVCRGGVDHRTRQTAVLA